jgi:cytochrome c-type biogenesis protein CcmH/NrfG
MPNGPPPRNANKLQAIALCFGLLAIGGGCSAIRVSGQAVPLPSVVETAPALDEAAALTAVARLDAQRNEAQCEQALAAWEQGRTGEARRSLEQVLERNPQHATARRLLADLALEQGDIATAERLLRELLADDSDNVAALTSLAWLYESQDRSEESAALFAQLAGVEPAASQESEGIAAESTPRGE